MADVNKKNEKAMEKNNEVMNGNPQTEQSTISNAINHDNPEVDKEGLQKEKTEEAESPSEK